MYGGALHVLCGVRKQTLTGLELPETDFVDLLEKLIGEAQFVQVTTPHVPVLAVRMLMRTAWHHRMLHLI